MKKVGIVMQNQEFINSLGVMDLISEKHKTMRANLISRVDEEFSAKISDMDIYMLSLSRCFSMSISEASRHMSITRQGAHKYAKRLQDMGLIQLCDSDVSKREKRIVLTDKGEEVCQKINKLKGDIEGELKAKLGEETYSQIKRLFRQVW